jgi:hypothetical protein
VSRGQRNETDINAIIKKTVDAEEGRRFVKTLGRFYLVDTVQYTQDSATNIERNGHNICSINKKQKVYKMPWASDKEAKGII